MLHQIDPSEKVLSQVSKLFKVLKINQLLHAANIRKAGGVSTQQIFEFIFLLVFHGKKMNNFLGSKRGQDLPGKDAYYRFLNNPKYSWRKFLLQLALKVTDAFNHLTSDKRVRVFILDDSILSRPRSKQAELLARVFDHTSRQFLKGYTLLTLGWSDGYSFVPVDFAMLSSAKTQNRLNDASAAIDKRTNGSKRSSEAIMEKPQNALRLLDNALNTGITADYVLMDSWFTNEPIITSLLNKGLHTIGMGALAGCGVSKDTKKFIPTKNWQVVEKQAGDLNGDGKPEQAILYVGTNKQGMRSWELVVNGLVVATLDSQDGAYTLADIKLQNVDGAKGSEILCYRYSTGSGGSQGLNVYSNGGKWQQLFNGLNTFDDGKDQFAMKYLVNYQVSFADYVTTKP